MIICKILWIFLIFCGVLFSDEVSDFAAFPDCEAEEMEDDLKVSLEEREKELKDDKVKQYIEEIITELEECPDSSLQSKLENILLRESNYSCYHYDAIRLYQKKHFFPDKDIRDALHNILLNCRGIKKEPPYSKCNSDTITFYTEILEYYGDETTLPILDRILIASQEMGKKVCDAYIAITRGEIRGKLWQYFLEDNTYARYMRANMRNQIASCCCDINRSVDEREQFRNALLKMYYLCQCDYNIGKQLLALRYYDLCFLRSYKWKLIALAKLYNDRDSIIELKLPRWQKIKLRSKKMEDCFQEIVKRKIPEESRILRLEQIMGNDGK